MAISHVIEEHIHIQMSTQEGLTADCGVNDSDGLSGGEVVQRRALTPAAPREI